MSRVGRQTQPENVLKSTLRMNHKDKVCQIANELGSHVNFATLVSEGDQRGVDARMTEIKRGRVPRNADRLRMRLYPRETKHTVYDAFKCLTFSDDGVTFVPNDTQLAAATLLSDYADMDVPQDELSQVCDLLPMASKKAAVKKIKCVLEGMRSVYADAPIDTQKTAEYLKVAHTAPDFKENAVVRCEWVESMIAGCEQIDSAAIPPDADKYARRLRLMESIIEFYDANKDQKGVNAKLFTSRSPAHDGHIPQLAVTVCGGTITTQWSRAGFDTALVCQREDFLNVAQCCEMRMTWCILTAFCEARGDVSVPPWKGTADGAPTGVSDVIDLVDRVHMCLGAPGCALADSFEQMIISRLLKNKDPLRFGEEYAATVRAKIVEDIAEHCPALVRFGLWSPAETIRLARVEILRHQQESNKELVRMAELEYDRLAGVVDRITNVDHYGEIYGLTRAWPYTHVNEVLSYNKFRKNVLKPPVMTNAMRVAIIRSRGAAILGKCARSVVEHNRLPEGTYTGDNELLRSWFRNRTVDLNMLAEGGPSLEDWAEVTLSQEYTLDCAENPSDLLKPKGAALRYSDLYAIYDENLTGIHHQMRGTRRLLLNVFKEGIRPIRNEFRTFMLGEEDLDEACFFVHPKERNYRYANAREYGWCNHQRRVINTVLESNIRETEIRANKDVTAGVPHHHMLADLMSFTEPGLEGNLHERMQYRMVRSFIGFDYSKWCLNKTAMNTAGPMGVFDDLFGLSQANIRQNPQWAGDTELHDRSTGCFSRVHQSFMHVVFACSARDLPDDILSLSDDELKVFRKMTARGRENFVKARLARYRAQLIAERDALAEMSAEERQKWVDENWRSCVVGQGKLPEGQMQSSWTGDTDADIKAPTASLPQTVDRKGTGDDQICGVSQKLPSEIPHVSMLLREYKFWYEEQLAHVRNCIIQHSEDLGKPMNADETYIAMHFAVYNKEVCFKGRLLGHLLKRCGRMATETNEIITDTDSCVGVCASSAYDGAGSHTDCLPALILSLMRAATVLVKSNFINPVTNQRYRVDIGTQVYGSRRFSWVQYIEWCMTHSAALDGPPILTLLAMLDRGFPDSLSQDVSELWFAAKGGHSLSAKLYGCMQAGVDVVPEPFKDAAAHMEDPYAVRFLKVLKVSSQLQRRIVAAVPHSANRDTAFGSLCRLSIDKERAKVTKFLSSMYPYSPSLVSDMASRTCVAAYDTALSQFSSPADMLKIVPEPEALLRDMEKLSLENAIERLKFFKKVTESEVMPPRADKLMCPTALCREMRSNAVAFDCALVNSTLPHYMVQWACYTRDGGALPLKDQVICGSIVSGTFGEGNGEESPCSVLGPHAVYTGSVTSVNIKGATIEARRSQAPLKDALREMCNCKWLAAPGGKYEEWSKAVCRSRCGLSPEVVADGCGERTTGCSAHRLGGTRSSGGCHPNCLPNIGTHLSWTTDTVGRISRAAQQFMILFQGLFSASITMASSGLTGTKVKDLPSVRHTIWRPRCPCCFEGSYTGKFDFTAPVPVLATVESCPILFTAADKILRAQAGVLPPVDVARAGTEREILERLVEDTTGSVRDVEPLAVEMSSAWIAYVNGSRAGRSSVAPKQETRRTAKKPILSKRIFSQVDLDRFLRYVCVYFLLDNLMYMIHRVASDGPRFAAIARHMLTPKMFLPLSDMMQTDRAGRRFMDYLEDVGLTYGMSATTTSVIGTLSRICGVYMEELLETNRLRECLRGIVIFHPSKTIFHNSRALDLVCAQMSLEVYSQIYDAIGPQRACQVVAAGYRGFRDIVRKHCVDHSLTVSSRVSLRASVLDAAGRESDTTIRTFYLNVSQRVGAPRLICMVEPDVVISTLKPQEVEFDGYFGAGVIPAEEEGAEIPVKQYRLPEMHDAKTREKWPLEHTEFIGTGKTTVYEARIPCPLGTNRGVHMYVSNLLKIYGRLGSAFIKHILEAYSEQLDPAVVLAMGEGPASALGAYMRDQRNIGGHYVSKVAPDDYEQGKLASWVPPGLLGHKRSEKVPYLLESIHGANDLTTLACLTYQESLCKQTLKRLGVSAFTCAWCDMIVTNPIEPEAVQENYRSAFVASRLAAQFLRPGCKYVHKTTAITSHTLFANLAGISHHFEVLRVIKNAFSDGRSGEVKIVAHTARPLPPIELFEKCVIVNDTVTVPSLMDYEEFMATFETRYGPDNVHFDGFLASRMRESTMKVLNFVKRNFPPRRCDSMALLCSTTCKHVRRNVDRQKDPVRAAISYLRQTAQMTASIVREVVLAHGKAVVSGRAAPGAVTAAIAGRRKIRVVDDALLRHTALELTANILEKRPKTAAEYEEMVLTDLTRRYFVEVSGERLYVEPDPQRWARSYARCTAFIVGGYVGQVFLGEVSGEQSKSAGQPRFLQSLLRYTDYDNVRHSLVTSRRCSAHVMATLSMRSLSPLPLCGSPIPAVLPRVGCRVLDGYTGEGALVAALHLDLLHNGITPHWVLHTHTRDASKALEVITNTGGTFEDRITMSPALGQSIEGAHLVILDIPWRKDGDMSMRSSTDPVSSNRLSFYDFLDSCLAQGALVLFTAAGGYRDGVVRTMSTHCSYGVADGRAVLLCWRQQQH